MINLKVDSNAEEVYIDIQASADRFPEAMQAFADDAVNIMTEIPRLYIPARHRRADRQKTTETSTGRLWRGWGRRGRGFSVGNDESSIADNIAWVDVNGEDVNVTVGTTIPYAGYVNVGQPFGQDRPEYLFSERGNEQVEKELEKALEYYAGLLDPAEQRRVGPSIKARGRDRSASGRFLKEIS